MEKKEKELTLNKQIEAIPEVKKQEGRNAYNNGEISASELQESWIFAGYMTRGYSHIGDFRRVIAKHGFKKYQSHGYLADHQAFMETWDWDKNSEAGLDPAKLKLRSEKAAWFKCGAGIHSSEQRRIYDHTRYNGCSKCKYEAHAEAFAIPKPGRSLLEVYPLVAAEFDAGGNEIHSSQVAAKSNRVIGTFIPSCGNPLHKPYKQQVSDRTVNEDNWLKAGNSGSWCPWCSNSMRSEFHGEVCEYISSLIPLESGADLLVNQMILPPDDSLPDGTKYPNEIDCLSHDLKFALEIHGYNHDYDVEGYTESKKKRAEALGFDFFVVWKRDWDDPEKREYLKEQLKVIIGFKVMDYLKKQNRSVSGVFWNGSDAA